MGSSSAIVHLMGPTCAGKSTLISRMVEIAPEKVHAVEVGKMLRAKYGEKHFAGQAAPAHTQGEAWQMYVNGVKEGISKKKTVILVDGQPRDSMQAKDILGLWKAPHRAAFVMVTADHVERERRARVARAPGANLDLAIARLENDYKNCYTVLSVLGLNNEVIRWIDTTGMIDAKALAEQMLQDYDTSQPL